MSASGSSEDMALVKKLNALEVENKQLKKGEVFIKILIYQMSRICTLGCFSKDTLKKIKCSPHHVTGGYLERSYPEGGADQTSLGGWH